MLPAPLGYRVVLAIGAAVCLAIAVYAWENRPKPGTRPLAGSMVFATVWLVTTLLSWSVADPATAMFWRKLTYVGITFDIFFVALFGIEYAGRGDLIRPSTVGALLVQPLLINALVWTNEAHGLVWDTATTPGTPSTFAYGPGFWSVVVYSYLVVFGVLVLLFRIADRTGGYYRAQVGAIVVGVAAPLVSNAAFLVVDTPYDLAPLAFTVTGASFGYAAVYRSFLDIGPVARDRLIAEMDDPVVVLDGQGDVIDANSAFTHLADASSPIGRSVKTLTGVDLRNGDSEAHTPVTFLRDNRSVHYDPEVSQLGPADQPLGYLVVLRDVTELTRRERDLDLMKRVTSRFLRHNLRNEMNVVTGRARTIARQTDDSLAGHVEAIDHASRDILRMADKARVVESVIDSGDEQHVLDVTTVTEQAIDDVVAAHPSLAVDVDAPSSARVRANIHLPEALYNLLENAAIHGRPDSQRASVTIDIDGERVRVTVEDDGPGIPRDEIDAVRSREESDLRHGSGIGLYLVTWIVEKSGGSVSFDGHASRVTLTLPAVTAAAPTGDAGV